MTPLAVDTSVAVPYLMRSHSTHQPVRQALDGRSLVLTGHSLAETYSVITRLPGDARVAPEDAVALLEASFDEPAVLDDITAATLPQILAPLGVAGGAVYDALVALAARAHGLVLASRDLRAVTTYKALSAEVMVVES
ncbi:MAG: PIN domain-containing protein [Iamia sp.]